MEASGWRSNCIFFNGNFLPSETDEIEDPQIIQISDPLAPEDNEVGIEEFSCMICSFPRCWFIRLGVYFHPLFGLPVEDADGIKSFLVGSSPSKDNDPIIISIVAHGAVGTMWGDIACGVYLSPFHCDGIESPKVVHIVGVYFIDEVPA